MQHHVSFALSAAFSHSPSHFSNDPCYPNLSLMSFKKSLSSRIVFGPSMFLHFHPIAAYRVNSIY